MIRTPGGERIVITGAQCITALGRDRSSTFEARVAGKSAIIPAGAELLYIPENDQMPFLYNVYVSAPIQDFGPQDVTDVTGLKGNNKLGAAHRSGLFSMYATALALQEAGLAEEGNIALRPSSEGGPDPTRVGMCIGSGIAGADALIEIYANLTKHGNDPITGDPLRRVPRIYEAFRALPERIVSQPGMYTGVKGPTQSDIAACATGNVAIISAIRALRCDEADVMVAGGFEGAISPIGLAIFDPMKAMTSSRDSLSASRPFDTGRDGFVLGEGGGVLVLETESHAIRRGATVLAVIAGYGHTSDGGHHATAPSEADTARAMSLALRTVSDEEAEGGIFINAHATSTGVGDPAELRSIKAAFGDRIKHAVAVTAPKGAHGHPAGGAGGIEAVEVVETLIQGIIPPIVGLKDPVEEADGIPLVIGSSMKAKVGVGVSNSFGFGGHNATLVIKREDG